MREIRKKRRFWRLVYSRVTIGFLAILFLLGLNAIWNVYGKYQSVAEERERAGENLRELEGHVEVLKEDIEYLKTVEGVEEEFRITFGLVKEGEGVIVIIDEENDRDIAAVGDNGLWSNVWQALKEVFGI